MFLKDLFFLLLFFHHNLAAFAAGASDDQFAFNGFVGANLTLDGVASITPGGLLVLTNATKDIMGHAFRPSKLDFRNHSNGSVLSFSTTFAFGIVSEDPNLSGHGIAFVVSPTEDFSRATGGQYLGILNLSNNGNSTNRVFAIELDTILNPEFSDINDNHVGIDINSLRSNSSRPAGYYDDGSGLLTNLTLISGQSLQVWVDYDGEEMQLNVTLAPIPMAKPQKPLLTEHINLSAIFSDSMFVGFSSSTGPFLTHHCIRGWSFRMNGTAQALDYSLLPPLPRFPSAGRSRVLEIVLPLASAVVVLIFICIIVLAVRRRMKYAEVLEDWELEYGPRRFSYKDLYDATNGFRDRELLGVGGFGRVYKGLLPSSKSEVAVKKVSHESRQGVREFIAEIVSLGRLRHRNLVQLLGYCRRRGELMLVYDYMPNGSLDKLLHGQAQACLDWATRFRIIRGVAAGLLYLHEDWEQVVVHRDIKASNVLLDDEMNGRLGDFGLARLYDHGTDLQTTSIVGTMGYLAPELARTGRASTRTDVFAFGIFALEVSCGRRPVDSGAGDGDGDQELVLADWVLEHWRKGSIATTRDPRLGEECAEEEVELVLKLGLLCAHPLPTCRPSMRQAVRYLEGAAALPELLPAMDESFSTGLALLNSDGFDDYVLSYPTTSSQATASSVSVSGR
ncbi:LOW QUALITY PROTEIN: L-type lectin-domain containing receptor kinase SIT2-like [Curcuma longa]|uniref:LOW QUALITY PROTEIN: L-type lectin-domain containing receptor kinase SIT2-like n=1 Tax=Curcuma longa TaxID=136217 RepID=UPI003D9FAFFD